MEKVGDHPVGQRLAREFSGPVLFYYVWWLLFQARKRGFHRLYFLARDGYVLREMAQLFSQKFHFEIECRYLYCSRMALRMPSYHLIGDEAYKLLFPTGGYQVTLRSMLQRADLSPDEMRQVCEVCGWNQEEMERLLNREEQFRIGAILKQCETFHHLLFQKSEQAYAPTIAYLKQEGLFDQQEVVLVDSGWTGSMQRSLRQLLRSAGYAGRLIGFYFGMTDPPKSDGDGTYLAWYFDHSHFLWNRVYFNNNLLECMLSAPHGMTVRYEMKGEQIVPMLIPMEAKMRERTSGQIQNILAYCQGRLEQTVLDSFRPQAARRETVRRIWRYMVHPTREEALYYGGFLFCDDMTEAYHLPMASEEQGRLLGRYTIPRRLLRRLRPSVETQREPELLWPFGTIAFQPAWKRCWYRWNLYLWETLKYIVRRAGMMREK